MFLIIIDFLSTHYTHPVNSRFGIYPYEFKYGPDTNIMGKCTINCTFNCHKYKILLLWKYISLIYLEIIFELYLFHSFKHEFTIVIFIHYKARIATAIRDL